MYYLQQQMPHDVDQHLLRQRRLVYMYRPKLDTLLITISFSVPYILPKFLDFVLFSAFPIFPSGSGQKQK
jgi:hypothetical protein